MADLSFVSNYDDCDPITREDVASIPANRTLFMTVHDRLCAYDACAWIQHFALNRPCTHPCTREPVPPSDVWECYFIAKIVQEQEGADEDVQGAIEIFQSTKLVVNTSPRADAPTRILVCPESPLFDVKILRLCALQDEKTVAGTEVKRIEYHLVDTRDHTCLVGDRRIANLTHPLSAVVALTGSR